QRLLTHTAALFFSVKTKIFFSIICLFVSTTIFAQTTRLHLIITNDKQEPFQNATAILYNLPDSGLKEKKVIKGEGYFDVNTNAYEVLEKVPGAIVDQDGNVYLSSTTPATIYINGREMKLSNTDIASLLKSLPSGSVSKIEILRSPSAKFDAASSGGIVNIVL